MATVNDPEEQEQNQPGQPLAVSGTAGASSTGGQGVGGATPQSPVAQNQAPQANTGYTDVATYLDANKGGSEQLGNMVSSNLTDQFNTTKSGVSQSAQSAQDAANKGYTPENTDLIQQVVNNPTQLAADDSNAALVQGQLNDRYTGPTDWTDRGTQQGKVDEAMQVGNLAKTPGGLNVLTQRVEGQTGGSQSQGINQLDTLLLGGSPDAMQNVQNASDPFKTLNDYINEQNTAVAGSISGAQSAADKARTNAETALLGPNGATGQFNTSIDTKTTAARQQAQALSDQIKSSLQSENPTAEQLATIGVSPDQWSQLQSQLGLAQGARTVESNQGQFGATTGTADIDLTNWLTQQSPEAQITRQNTASADDYARGQALQKLIGSDRFTTDLTDPSQAGTAPTNLNQFNYEGALGTTKGTADAELAAAQAYVDALQAGADEEHAQLEAQNALKNKEYNGTAMLAQTPVASTELATNAISQSLTGGTPEQIISKPQAAATNVAANVATGGLYTPVNQAVNTIGKIFCFHPDTLIEMWDGSCLPICRLDVGDHTRGGRILAIKKAVASDCYYYRGVVVTGFHAVKEGGTWLRVKDSKQARRIESYTEVVHNLVTADHRIWSNGVEFADEHETDQYEMLDLNQSLEALNREPVR